MSFWKITTFLSQQLSRIFSMLEYYLETYIQIKITFEVMYNKYDIKKLI